MAELFQGMQGLLFTVISYHNAVGRPESFRNYYNRAFRSVERFPQVGIWLAT